MAGFVALVNSARLTAGKAPLGMFALCVSALQTGGGSEVIRCGTSRCHGTCRGSPSAVLDPFSLLNNLQCFCNADSCVTLLTLRTLVSRRYLLRHSVPIVCVDLILLSNQSRLAEPRPVPALRLVRQRHYTGRQQLRRERSGVLRPRLLCPPRVGPRHRPGVSRLRRFQGCFDGIGRGSHCGANVRGARAHAAAQQRAGTDGGAKCLPHVCERVRMRVFVA
jgi:hypothetical protein